MALLDLWRDAPASVLAMPIQQIVVNAGDGTAGLDDGSLAMAEFQCASTPMMIFC